MAWIESHTRLRNHPKLITFCTELKIDRAQAIGHLHMFWWWAIEQRENGDLIGTFEREIANAADWPGDPKRLVKALQKANFIDKQMRIVDWMDYVGRLIRDRERKRTGVRRGNSREGGSETPHIPNRTEPNPTVPYRKIQNPGVFTKEQIKRIKIRIKEVRNIAPEAMGSDIALFELNEIVQKNKPDDPMGYVMGILNKEEKDKQ